MTSFFGLLVVNEKPRVFQARLSHSFWPQGWQLSGC